MRQSGPLRSGKFSGMGAAIVVALCVTAGIAALPAQTRTGTLDIYYIDTEGGQSTLFVSPSGESLLVDTGNAGDRDLGRIAETLRTAGIKQIDHMWSTHYHGDHIGALLALARQFPMMHFYDHGKPHPSDRIISAAFLSSYDELSRGKRTVVKPGDKVRMAGLDITAVASANQYLRSNLSGGGRQNATCAAVKQKDESAYTDTDNGESAGFVLAYGRFRTIDLGDLTWNGELDLMCPVNRIGTVDLYLTSHHGLDRSGSPALVHALQPRVAVMNNGTRKGGTPDAFRVLYESPGLEDLWQLHWSHNVGLDNAPAMFVANVDDNPAIANVLTGAAAPRGGGGAAAAHSPAHLIKVSAQQDGTFTVTNTRNSFSKTYRPRP
jgi:beta-lactamase superfamily II metal-dependent hydrolase